MVWQQILMTGEVAGLFPKDELDAIVNDIRPVMKAEAPGQDRWATHIIQPCPLSWVSECSLPADVPQTQWQLHASQQGTHHDSLHPQIAAAGVVDTWDNLYSFFLERVRNKLHVCLCFSPVGIKFSRRAQQFPGLINGCTIDWFLPWPEEALTSVSGKFIDEFSMACPDSVKDSLKLMMGSVHVNVTAACQVKLGWPPSGQQGVFQLMLC